MTIWLIEPRDPVIFRDGRPFNASPGARAQSLPFPFPATVAGAARTRAGQRDSGRFDEGRIGELMGKQVRGPMLVEISANGQYDWLFPAPYDALHLKHEPFDKQRTHVVPLTVVDAPDGAATDLSSLKLIGLQEAARQKPHPNVPAFWRWDRVHDWLISPTVMDITLTQLGHPGPARESRMHVSIEADTQTAQDGALFQTSGLEFVSGGNGTAVDCVQLAGAKSLGLVLETDAAVKEGLDFLGGERRVVRWRSGPPALPSCPPVVRELIVQHKHCRLILATPACFANGYLPVSSGLARSGVTVSVQAVANSRYQAVSGWDYQHKKPKPTRRLAPAGSVYFLKLEGNDAAIRQFVDEVWLQAISDDERDRLDGYGLALLGAWDGVPKSMIYQAEAA